MDKQSAAETKDSETKGSETKDYLIVGTSHIAKQSINEIESSFQSFKPDMVAVELDRKRHHALLNDAKPNYSIMNIKRLGVSGYLFAVIGAMIQRKLGKYVGLQPGSDMLSAIKLAQKNSLKVALIDQDIEITMQRLSREFTFREKMRIVADFFSGMIFRKKQMEELGITHLDLTKLPEDELISKLMLRLKQRYPSLYNVLVEERNKVMASNIMRLRNFFPGKKILIVVGAGHRKGLEEMLKALEHKKKQENIRYEFNISI